MIKLMIILPLSSGSQFFSFCLYNIWGTWPQRMPESKGNLYHLCQSLFYVSSTYQRRTCSSAEIIAENLATNQNKEIEIEWVNNQNSNKKLYFPQKCSEMQESLHWNEKLKSFHHVHFGNIRRCEGTWNGNLESQMRGLSRDGVLGWLLTAACNGLFGWGSCAAGVDSPAGDFPSLPGAAHMLWVMQSPVGVF